MARKANLVGHLSTKELKREYRSSRDPVEAKRWHLLWKVSAGWTIKNSALAVGVHYQYALQVIKKYNERGREGIKNKKKNLPPHRRGRCPLLNEEQFKKLQEAFKERPADGGIWTGPKVARWIQQETGREKVHHQRGWDYLKKCGYSWQRPRRKHKKGCPVEQAEFKKNLPIKVQELQEKSPNTVVEVYFFDEHRLGLQPILRKVWALVGSRPIAEVQPRYEWLYVYGFVEPKTGKTHWYLIPRVNTKWLNLVYQDFARQVGAGENKIVLVVQDRAGWHLSDKVILPAGIIPEYLPAYSPELQPAERLWSLVDEPLVNRHFETIEELEEVLAERCRVLQTMTEEIKNLTDYYWFTYA